MNDDHAFIATIRADPDSDAPRLVYADYLEERGDAERANYIRLSIADTHGAQYTAPVELCWLHRPEAGLPLDWGKAWGVRLKRGFVEWLRLPAEDWLRNCDAIYPAHPLRQVLLTSGLRSVADNGRSRRVNPKTRYVLQAVRGEWVHASRRVSDAAGHAFVHWLYTSLPPALENWQCAVRLAELSWPGVAFTLPRWQTGGNYGRPVEWSEVD